MVINPPKAPEPAVIDLREIITQAKTAIESTHKAALKKLRAEHKAWIERQEAISPAALYRAEVELLEKWEAGTIAPDAILTAPTAEGMRERLLTASRRIESYGDYLEKCAAPIVADLLDVVADGIERDILPQAAELDGQAKKFGEAGTVAGRVLSSITRHKEEANRFRSLPALALDRLQDFIDL